MSISIGSFCKLILERANWLLYSGEMATLRKGHCIDHSMEYRYKAGEWWIGEPRVNQGIGQSHL